MGLASDFFDFNEDHADALGRALQLQGPRPARLDPLIQAGINLVDLNDQQYQWLFRTGTYVCGEAAINFAAQVPATRLLNPAGSGKIARVRFVRLAAASVSMAVYTTVLAANAAITPVLNNGVTRTPGPRDGRIPGTAVGTPSPACTFVSGSCLGSLSQGDLTRLELTSFQQWDPLVTLNPGSSLWVTGGTAASSMYVTIAWDERNAVSSELA